MNENRTINRMSSFYAEFKLVGAIAVLVSLGATSLFAGKLNYDEDELYVSKIHTSNTLPPMQPSLLPLSIKAHRQYSRKVVWLKHLVLYAACVMCTVNVFNLPEPVSAISYTAWFAQILTFIFLVYLDDVNIIGTGYQRKFLYVYFLLTLLGAIEFVWQQTTLSLSLFLCYAIVLGASIFVSFFNFYKLLSTPPTPEYTSNLLTYVSFSYLNKILIKPNMKKEAMEFEDVPRLHDDDCTEPVYVKFQRILRKQSELDLITALVTLVWPIWLEQGFFQWLSSTATFFAPLALEKILIFVNCSGDTECYYSQGFLPVSPYMAVLILFMGPLMKSVGDGQNYVRGRHIGVRLKAALIGCIFNKSIHVDLSASRESVGKLNNLISVDVGEIQNFWCYSHFVWSTLYEIIIATTLLCVVLGKAAVAGILTMLVFMAAGFYLGAKLEGLQSRLLANKDKRISIINEVLNSIRIIKYYAWEGKFIDKINLARLQELAVLLLYCSTGAFLFVIWEVVPSIVGVVAFLTYTQILGHSMSPSLGFTALTLFSTLRFPLSQLPEMITLFITCRTSLRRIRDYLVTSDLPGLPALPPQGAPKGSIIIQNLTAAWRRVKKDEDIVDVKTGKKMALCENISQSMLRSAEYLEKGGLGAFCCFTKRQESTSHVNSGGSYRPPGSSSRSGNRYSRLLDEEEADVDVETPSNNASSMNDNAEQDIQVIIKNVNLRIQPGSLNIIIGATGSGKSSLLSAILGETLILSGERFMVGEVSYSTQTAWIQNETLRDNILFGTPFDPIRYNKVIKACSLEADLKLFPLGDQTEIGEKGVNLSGGQQQRVSLARAAYAKSDIIILDDPLSAVDAHVGEHIFRELILDLLKDRTVLLVTHNLPMALASAHQVLYMDADQQTLLFQCPPLELYRSLQPLLGSPEMGDDNTPTFMKVVYGTLVQIYGTLEMNLISLPAPPVAKRELSVEEMLEDQSPPELKTNLSYNLLPLAESKYNVEAGEESERDAPTYDGSGKYNVSGTHQIVAVETKNKGEVTWQTYWFYFKAWGGVLPVAIVVSTSFWIAISWFLQSYTLGLWMQSMTTTHSLHNITLTYYLLCVLSLILSYVTRGLAQVAYGIKASEKIHSSLIKCILLAPCGWFDATPIGRIINRCSKDISTVDSNLMYHLLGFIDCLIGAVQVFLVIIIFLPPLLLFLLPVIAFTAYVTYQYVHISRELKRLESLKNSPVFVLFSETLQGMSVLRSFANQPLRFHSKLCAHIDNMNACHLFLWICNRWLNFRMQCLGALVSGAVAVGIVYTTQNHSSFALSSASAGLALMYSLGFCDNLTFLARTHADCQMDLNSVERIEEYSTTPSEKYNPPPEVMGDNAALRSVFSPYLHDRILDLFLAAEGPVADKNNKDIVADSPERGLELKARSNGAFGVQRKSEQSSSWPSSGHLAFRNVFLRYPTSSTPVLRGVSFDLPGGKRLGVVGRTGAGKSSLVSALFRLVELEGGQILLDGKDTSQLPLLSLRQAIGIVPQEPSLFGGTLRSNLDPFSEHSDQDIWNALRIARLEDYIRSLGEQQSQDSVNPLSSSSSTNILNSVQVAERGGNFSRGQRQLLCLARALLRPPPLLILDECTASVDAQTDALIQEAVRYGLPNSTVLCIAHRLQTVAYYDLILLLDGGEVREFGCPHSLLQSESSAFYHLCQSSGSLEELKDIAAQAAKERLNKQGNGAIHT